MKRGILLVAAVGSFFFGGCDNSSSNEKSDGKPIVMGDPATIVTETDSTYLQDMVADLRPGDLSNIADSVKASLVDTTKRTDTLAKAEPAPAQNTSGLSVAFKEVTVNIPGIKAKSAANQGDLQKASGATYQLTDGKLDGSTLQVSGATITRVSMRYQSDVSIKNQLGTLPLDNLGSTTGWKTIKGNNTYAIDIPSGRQIQTQRINQGTVRNAIVRTSRAKRLNKKTQQQWLNSVRNIPGPQKPLEITVRAVMFKIDGKDKAGKSFSKQVRIDL